MEVQPLERKRTFIFATVNTKTKNAKMAKLLEENKLKHDFATVIVKTRSPILKNMNKMYRRIHDNVKNYEACKN